MSKLSGGQLNELAAQVRLCVFDVDGVLTDGKIILGPDNTEFKAFDVKDGQGLVMLGEIVEVGIITGRQSEIVNNRMAQLGIRHVYQGQKNKLEALHDLLSKLRLSPQQVCYVGDDLPDLPVMALVGLPIAVADAVATVKDGAKFCTSAVGGSGAAREVCELILRAQGHPTDGSAGLASSATNGTLS